MKTKTGLKRKDRVEMIGQGYTGLKLQKKRTGLTQKGRNRNNEESRYVKEIADAKKTRFDQQAEREINTLERKGKC